MKSVKDKVFFWVSTWKISFAPIFMCILVIRKSKYIGIRSFKALKFQVSIRGILLSKADSQSMISYIPVYRVSSKLNNF